MALKEEDILWTLDGAREFSTQEDLYNHLEVSDHLKNTIYQPPELKQQGNQSIARIQNKTFERVNFSKTEISGISFRNCTFDHCLFVASKINNCEFHDCRFVLTNIFKISISHTYIDPMSFARCLVQKKHQNIGVHLYQVLLKNSRRTEQIEFERDAHFLFLRWKRFQEAYEIKSSWKARASHPLSFQFVLICLRYVHRWAWEKLFGSGLRVRYFVVTVFLVIISLSTLNYICRDEFGLMQENDVITSFWEALYFTTISVTTLGYGDITPTTVMGRMVATVQSIAGFCLFAILASMLFRRISP